MPMPSFRLLVPGDVHAYRALRLRCLRECPTAFGTSPDEEAAVPLDVLAARLAPRPGGGLWGAFDEAGALVALARAERSPKRKCAHTATLTHVYVAPEARGQGTGEALLRAVLAYAADVLGVERVTLGVEATNRAATALYERLGFETTGVERDFLRTGGVSCDLRLMSCALLPPPTPLPP